MVKFGELFLEDRAARFEPTVDLREDSAEPETFQAFRETRQNAHDDAPRQQGAEWQLRGKNPRGLGTRWHVGCVGGNTACWARTKYLY